MPFPGYPQPVSIHPPIVVFIMMDSDRVDSAGEILEDNRRPALGNHYPAVGDGLGGLIGEPPG